MRIWQGNWECMGGGVEVQVCLQDELPAHLLPCSFGQAQSFLGRASGRRRASHGSVFRFRAPGQDISLPEGPTDDEVFLGDSGSHRGSLLLGGGANQQGPLPGSPLPQPSTPGSVHEEGQPALPTGELGPGVADVPVSLRMLLTLLGCPHSPECAPGGPFRQRSANACQLLPSYRQGR